VTRATALKCLVARTSDIISSGRPREFAGSVSFSASFVMAGDAIFPEKLSSKSSAEPNLGWSDNTHALSSASKINIQGLGHPTTTSMLRASRGIEEWQDGNLHYILKQTSYNILKFVSSLRKVRKGIDL